MGAGTCTLAGAHLTMLPMHQGKSRRAWGAALGVRVVRVEPRTMLGRSLPCLQPSQSPGLHCLAHTLRSNSRPHEPKQACVRCHQPQGTQKPARTMGRAQPSCQPQPGRAGGVNRHKTQLGDCGVLWVQPRLHPTVQSRQPAHWLEPSKHTRAQGAGARDRGTHFSMRALPWQGRAAQAPPGRAGQPGELCQRLSWTGVADRVWQKPTE